MSISSTARTAGPFTGDGTTATFPFNFKVFEDSDLYVVTLNVVAGTIAELALTTDYTVTLNADQDSSPGGSIALTAGNLAAGYTLAITTDMQAVQGLTLTNAGGFYPDVVNAALDTLTILIQQVLNQLGRAIQVPFGDPASSGILPPGPERAGKLLMFDSSGNLSLITVAPGGTIPGGQKCPEAAGSGNKIFTFQAGSSSTPAPMVFAGGIYQTPGDDYTSPVVNVAGTTWQIEFFEAPTQGPITVLLFA